MKRQKIKIIAIVIALIMAVSLVMTACRTERNPDELMSIRISTPPNRTVFFASDTAGEPFDPAGMVVTAQSRDGSTRTAENFTFSPAGNLALGTTAVTVYYTRDGITRTATQNITVEVFEISEETRNRVREFISFMLEYMLPPEAADVIDGAFGSEDKFADEFIAILTEAFLFDDEIEALIDLVESIADFESSFWTDSPEYTFFFNVFNAVLDLDIPNGKVASFLWATVTTVNNVAEELKTSLIAIDPYDAEWVGIVEMMFEMEVLSGLAEMEADQFRLAVTAALDASTMYFGMLAFNTILMNSEDMPTREEFVTMMTESRVDMLAVLDTLNTEAIEAIVALGKIFAVPYFMIQGMDATEFFGIAEQFVNDWEYLRTSLVATVSALSTELIDALYESTVANNNEDMSFIVLARLLNAGLIAEGGVNNERAGELMPIYVQLLIDAGLFDMEIEGEPITAEQVMEYIIGDMVEYFFRDVAIIAGKGLTDTLGPEYDANLFVILLTDGQQRHIEAGQFAAAWDRGIAIVYSDGWVSLNWSLLNWGATEMFEITFPGVEQFEGATIDLGVIRMNTKVAYTLTYSGHSMNGYLFASSSDNDRVLFVHGDLVRTEGQGWIDDYDLSAVIIFERVHG